MKLLNIASLQYGSDGGSASQIRTEFIIKGLSEHNVDIVNLSYRPFNIKNDKLLERYHKDDSFYYACNKEANGIWGRVLNNLILPFLFFVKLCKYSKSADVIFCDKIPLQIAPYVLIFKMFSNKKMVLQYNEFFVLHYASSFVIKQLFKLHVLLLKLLLRKAVLIITFSEFHAQYFRKYAADDVKTVVVPMFLDNNNFKIPSYNNKDVFKIAYAGALSTSNGIDMLIDAFILHLKNNQNSLLYLIGPSNAVYTEKLKTIININNLDNKIILKGSMPNSDALSFMSDCDLLVIPKITDERSVAYFSCKLGDYLSTGKIVLSTNIGSISEYITDGVNGYLCKPDSVDDMCDKINFINDNKQLHQEIGLKGQQKANVFDYKVQCGKIYDMLT